MVGSLDDVKMNTGANQGAVSRAEADSFKIRWFWFAIHWLLIDMFRLLVSYRCLDSSGSHSFFFFDRASMYFLDHARDTGTIHYMVPLDEQGNHRLPWPIDYWHGDHKSNLYIFGAYSTQKW